MKNIITITPSEIIEYNYCPRFIYFMFCLGISQKEEKRYKVLKGRNVHEEKLKINQNYLRKKLGVVDKKCNVYMCSEELRLRGIVDEILFFDDGSAAPLDYKYAEYNENIFNTHKYQLIQYALLIESKYSVPVNKGFLCYTRSKNYLHKVSVKMEDKVKALEMINDVLNIIIDEKYPKPTNRKTRCLDCCYRNICIK